MVDEMVCTELVELVTEYLDGALSAAESARLRDHLASCDGCQAHVEQMRATVRVLQTEPEEQTSPGLAESLAGIFRKWPRPR